MPSSLCRQICWATRPPSPPPPPTPPPLPPLPPLSPGYVAAASEDQLRNLITEAAATQANVSIYLQPSADFKLNSRIRCTSTIKVTVASSGEGATLDGQGETGLFHLSGRCSLTLRGLNLVNGRAENGQGGVVYARSGKYGDADYAGDVEIIESVVRDCSAPGAVRRVELAALQRRAAAGREMERATAASLRSLLATAGWRRLHEVQRCGLDNQLERVGLLGSQCAPRRASRPPCSAATAAGREMERATAALPRSLLATAVGRRRLRGDQRCGLDNRLDRVGLLG